MHSKPSLLRSLLRSRLIFQTATLFNSMRRGTGQTRRAAAVPASHAVLVLFAFVYVANAGPTVTTGGAGSIGTTTATLNGSVNPNGQPTMAYFEWGPTTSYGNADPNPYFNVGYGTTKLGVSLPVGGLSPNSTYHFHIVALWTSAPYTLYDGGDQTFTTSPLAPTVSTSPTTGITAYSATLNGTVNPNGATTIAYFEWGLSTAYDQLTQQINEGSGQTTVIISATLTTLNPNTTYHYACVAHNTGGINAGADETFTTGSLAPTWIRREHP